MLSLDGCAPSLTGGTGKLGAALAELLRGAGWNVVAAGRADGDVSRPDEARALVERAVGELEGLDVLVNAAGAGFVRARSRR